MKLKNLAALIVILAACETAYAQVETVADGSFGISVSAKIKGKPFSADVTKNEDFKPINGREIHFEYYGKMYRDSEGRIRVDRQRVFNGKTAVEPTMIVDPVQQIVMTIEHNSRTVIIRHGSKPPEAQKTDSTPAEKTSASASKPETQLPGSEPLGTMVLEGFTVRGTRYTHNDPPTKTESWIADDLGMVLLMKTEGPQEGTVITSRLTNIVQKEPDQALFQAPADYTVKDMGVYPGLQTHK
jgi:hypothetical protein